MPSHSLRQTRMASVETPASPTAEGQLTEEFAVPSHVEAERARMAEFAERHASAGRRVVLITSGGTKVPLESRTVRFLDNFSSGRRGASSAEYFLDSGYAVIFLHRHHSLFPYTRLYSGVNLMDALQMEGDGGSDQVMVDQQVLPNIASVLKRYRAVKAAGLLLPVEFSTLSEYLHLLKAAAQALSSIGTEGSQCPLDLAGHSIVSLRVLRSCVFFPSWQGPTPCFTWQLQCQISTYRPQKCPNTKSSHPMAPCR